MESLGRYNSKARGSYSRVRKIRNPLRHANNTDFKQQRLKSCKPRITVRGATIGFLVMAAFMGLLGVFCLVASQSVHSQTTRYDDVPGCSLEKNPPGTPCQVSIVLEKDMAAPIFIYYRMENFYANHRAFVKSRSDKQLRETEDDDDHDDDDRHDPLNSCKPLNQGHNGSQAPLILPMVGDAQYTGNVSTSEKYLYPCGLHAQSFFNDHFTACLSAKGSDACAKLEGEDWSTAGITWDWDLVKKFKDRSLRADETRWNQLFGYEMPKVTDPDFVNWMRAAPLPSFAKLYRKISSTSLKAGETLTFTITNNYPSFRYGGSKGLEISTASVMGGQNLALGISCLSVALISAVFALIIGRSAVKES